MKFLHHLKRFPVEAIIWAAGLIALACYDPGSESHATLCPFSNFGFPYCPGCGLGHAIAYFFRGEFILSWHAHPLGIFAVFMLLYRIITLTLNYIHVNGKNY